MKTEHLPSISVLMSVYNGERWLNESIESILNQTFKNFEFIIVNDGSNDDSLDIINSFAKEDSRIRFYDKKNSGLADSLNYGIEKANGEWIARIDADDICCLERLEKQFDIVQSNKELVLVGSGLVIIDENGRHIKVHHYPQKDAWLRKRLSRAYPFFAHSSAFFKLNAAKQLGGYRKEFDRSQDQDLWLRLSEVGKITSIKEPLVFIRKHDKQISLDETGQKQFIFSHIAMTSHRLRVMGQDDPVASGSKTKFDNFLNFIFKSLQDDGFFENQKLIDDLKIKISNAKTNSAKLNILAINILIKPNLAYRYIKYRVFGSNLPKIFAHKWIGHSKKIAQK